MPVFGGNDADHALIVAIVNRYRHTSRTRFRMPPAWHSDGDADNVATVAVTFVRCHVYIIHAIRQLHQLHSPLLSLSSLVFSYLLHWIPLNFTFEVLPRTQIPCNPSSGKPAGGNVLRSVSHHDMLMSWYISLSSLYIIIWHRSEVRLGLGGLRGPVAAAHWCLDVWRSPVSCGTCERCNEINEIKDSTFKKLRPHLDWFIPHPDLIMKHEATCILIRVCPLFFFIFLPLLFLWIFFFRITIYNLCCLGVCPRLWEEIRRISLCCWLRGSGGSLLDEVSRCQAALEIPSLKWSMIWHSWSMLILLEFKSARI